MNTQFEVGQIIRQSGVEGSPTYKVEGFVMDLLMVRCTDGVWEEEFFHPDQVELYEFSCNIGTYKIGDRVRVLGFEGEWTVLNFTQSCCSGELLAVLENFDGVACPVEAHYVNKIVADFGA